MDGGATDVAGAMVPTGAIDDGDDEAEADDPHRATVADGQLLVRMLRARPHSLGSMDSFH